MKLTQEQLAELIAKVFTSIDEKRKTRKENGEDIPDTISNEEILAEVDAILSELDSENTEPAINEKATEPAESNTADENSDKDGKTIPITPELISQIIENLNKTKLPLTSQISWRDLFPFSFLLVTESWFSQWQHASCL